MSGLAISQDELDSLGVNENNVSNAETSIATSSMPPVAAEKASFSNLNDSNSGGQSSEIDFLNNIPLELSVELGKTKKTIKEILDFGLGSVIELDKISGEPVELLANGEKIARGEVVVIDDNFGIRVTEIINPKIK